MKIISTVVLILFVGTMPLLVAWSQEDRAAQIEERIVEAKERLDLNDEQIEQLTPVLKSGFEAQMAVLKKYGIDLENRASGNQGKLRFREARKLRKDMDVVRESTLGQVEGILTEEQFSEYKKIQDERKKQMRELIKNRR